jgi:hypothetical protein
MKVIFEMGLTLFGMGFTTSGIILAAENKTQWPLVLVFIGIPVLLLACQFDDYEGSQNETRKP